ncbi:MAG TPA: 50S ribosomal protein L4 [bacterium]|nr:50S ribosomal protein L4 [bacterium]
MIKYKVYNQQAEVVGEQQLTEKVFGLTVNQTLVHQAMVAQLANSRDVLADTKDRSEVSGGGKKPWKQKGTGRARAGSSRSPLWIGGGVTFGPTSDRNFSQKINKKMLAKAICMIFSDRVASHDMIIVDDLEVKESKTKEMKVMVDSLLAAEISGTKVARPRTVVLTGPSLESVKLAGRNLDRVQVLNNQNINVVSLLRANKIIISQQAVNDLQKRYGAEAAQ